MADNSAIEWTDATWNPVTGCTKISLGCQNCYAERMARRLQAMGTHRYRNGFNLTLHEDLLEVPLSWKRGRRIFVNSMSDLFHPKVPTDFIIKMFAVMERAKQHTFQILTKRAERLRGIAPLVKWAPNIWMGVTIESPEYWHRAVILKKVPAAVRFLSVEPLLAPLGKRSFSGISWVIVGGESGPRSRPIQAEWVRSIRNQCNEQNVDFFFKQWGGVNKKAAGRILDRRAWNEMPARLEYLSPIGAS